MCTIQFALVERTQVEVRGCGKTVALPQAATELGFVLVRMPARFLHASQRLLAPRMGQLLKLGGGQVLKG